MKTHKFWILVDNELLGPYSAKEMVDLDLPDYTPVTDDLEGEKWHTAEYFDFREISINQQKEDKGESTDVNFTLRMDGGTYSFYYKKNGKTYGPRTAKNMYSLNLPPDTPVTEASMDGLWLTAGNFDFETLYNDEKDVRNIDKKASGRNAIVGLIWMVAGILVTVISYYTAAPGGTYIISFGAIIGGLIQFVGGLAGDTGRTSTDENGRRFYSSNKPEQDATITLTDEELKELYAELELGPTATDKEVNKAYRSMAMRYHPDRNVGFSDDVKDKVTARFLRINDAYELIKQLRKTK